MQWQDFFRGKRVTQMGLGLLGRGIHDAQFLSTYVAELVVTDLKNDEQLKSSVEQVSAVAPEGVVKFVLGEHVQGDFEQADFIIKGAGVPLQNEYVDVARARGVPVYMDEALFFMLAPEALRFVGITGTRGKTTTTMLLHHILATAKQRTGEQVQIHLAGNIRDVATLPLLEVATAQDAVIA
jgi:UDP-N-acetylmuramoylalanine--D-glutamate ligase